MSEMLGNKVTKRALDSYTSESMEQNRFPLEYAVVFCTVLSDFTLLRKVARLSDHRLIDVQQAKILNLGKQILLRDRAAAEVARLQHELQGVTLG